MKGDIGALQRGAYADIIGVEGDPLNDVSVLKSVLFVMKDGKVVKKEMGSK